MRITLDTTAIVASGRNDLFDFSAREKENVDLQALQLEIYETDRQYCTPMLNHMAYAVLRTWIKNGCQESAEDLYGIMKRGMRIISENM